MDGDLMMETIRSKPTGCKRLLGGGIGAALAAALVVSSAFAQPGDSGDGSASGGGGGKDGPLPSIAEKTRGFERLAGYLPLYWDDDLGRLYMEIARFDEDLLHVNGLGAGLGSNDIGIDRGALAGSRIVRFELVGRKVLLVQPNTKFRASRENEAERQSISEAFARSVLWGFEAVAATEGAVLVELSDFLLRDAPNLAVRLRPGTWKLDRRRSSIYRPMTMNFPLNTELEAELTFTLQGGPGGGSFPFPTGGGFRRDTFEAVGDVAAARDAASIRLHHTFTALPDDGYEPRLADPRAGYIETTYQDYSAPLGEPMTQRFINRHRLEKKDPSAAMSDPVEPIIYYLDDGTPEPVRTALLDGARWWNQAFEAAGYRNAFQVQILPEGVSRHDIRYNVINWVHRSTRGWSTGGSVTDPRTGEIIKGVVTLGSLRIRQDYLIAEGLLAPYEDGDEVPEELEEWALARIRQLSAHEVGHTIGLSHNYYDSSSGRTSVMDYPHPLITLDESGEFVFDEVYENEIGEWDKVAIAYGYQDFPEGVDEAQALSRIIGSSWSDDVRFLTNQDTSIHPRANQWSNGTDPAAELERMMEVRSVALSRFGERVIRRGAPLATLEEALVPLYLHHRFQIEAAAAALGGIDYIYAVRGDGRSPFERVPAEQQLHAMRALIDTLHPEQLALPAGVLELIPPRPSGYRPHRELFPRYTGSMFDAVSPAVVAADMTLAELLEPARAARLVEQNALDQELPGLEDLFEAIERGTFGLSAGDRYQAEVSRAVERVVVDRMVRLAGTAPMPQVRALATSRLSMLSGRLEASSSPGTPEGAHRHQLALDIDRFLERVLMSQDEPSEALEAPPGAPIGEPSMPYLRGGWDASIGSWFGYRFDPRCSWD